MHHFQQGELRLFSGIRSVGYFDRFPSELRPIQAIFVDAYHRSFAAQRIYILPRTNTARLKLPRLTRENLFVFEITFELIQFLESLPSQSRD